MASDPDSEDLQWELVPEKAPVNGDANVSGNGSSPSVLSYIPSAIGIDEDEFSIRVSDGRNYDEIRIKAVISWEVNRPVLSSSSVDRVIPVVEGESFSTEVAIVYSDQREKFSVELIEGPDWVSVYHQDSFSFIIKGNAPTGNYDDFDVTIRVQGERA